VWPLRKEQSPFAAVLLFSILSHILMPFIRFHACAFLPESSRQGRASGEYFLSDEKFHSFISEFMKMKRIHDKMESAFFWQRCECIDAGVFTSEH
jgi:hypothetical protein